MDSKSFIADMLLVLREVSTHDMDYLRVWAVDTCISVSSILSKEDYKSKIVPIIRNIQDDTSWRVRSRLGEKLTPMIHALQEQKNQALVESTLLPIYAALLIDRETEVRLHAVAQLPAIAEALKGCAALVEHLHQSLAALTNDQEANVRLAFAKTLVPLCNAFPRDAGGKLLLPLMQSMANDDQHSVRRAVVEQLHALTDNNGILTQMVPQVLALASDPKWRVRMSAIGKTGLLAEALGQRVFERKVQEVLIVSLSDHVSAIREKACEQSGKVVAAFGGTWAGERFFPAAFSIYNPNKNYLHRMTCLHLISCICDEKVTGEGPRDCFQTTFLDLLCQAFSDEVANVRLMACQTLYKMLSKLTDSQIQTRVAPAIRTLAGDTDSDVSYFAGVCQEAIAKTS